jgi:hypothetical protein
MNVRKLYNISRDFITEPRKAWRNPAYTEAGKSVINRSFILPMSFLSACCAVIGALLFAGVGDNYGFWNALVKGLMFFLIVYFEIQFSSFLIKRLGERFNIINTRSRFHVLVGYSHAAFFPALMLWGLFPPLFIVLAAGIYSFRLLSLGSAILKGISAENRNAFVFLSCLIVSVTYLILSLVFNNLYTAYTGSFATFGN